MCQNCITIDQNTRASFRHLKQDVLTIGNNISEHRAIIKKLVENQKYLLIRLRNLEKKSPVQPIIREPVQEKRIVISTNTTSPKVRVQEYVGSKSSMRFHNPVCPYSKNIKPKNKVVFKSKTKPLNLGYKACDCLKRV